MKKFMALVIITLALIFLSGLYIWFSYHDNVIALTHVQNPDWAVSHTISRMNSSIYDSAVGENGILYTVWDYPNPATGKNEILLTTIQAGSETVIESKPLLSTAVIQGVNILPARDHFTLFWVSQENSGRYGLYQNRFSPEGTELGTPVFVARVSDSILDLDAVSTADGGCLLVWTEASGPRRVIQTVRVEPSGKTSRITAIHDHEDSLSSPRLSVDSTGQVHLLWLHHLAESNSRLYYAPLHTDGSLAAEPVLIDEGKLRSPTLLAHGQQLYLAWDKANPNIFGSWDIHGTALNVGSSANPADRSVVRKLTREDSSNSTPAFAADSSGQVHLVAVKTKNNFTSLTHSVFAPGLQSELQSARWVCPEPHRTIAVRLMTDYSGALHLVWLDQSVSRQYSCHSTNTLHKPHITALQLVGVSARNPGQSFVLSLIYILVWPFIDLRVILFILISLFSAQLILPLYLGFIAAFICTKVDWFLSKYGVAMVFFLVFQFCMLIVIFDYISTSIYTDLFHQYAAFACPLALAACLIYSRITEMRKTEAMYGMYLSFLWVFWYWIIILTLNLPNMNFIIPPAI